MAAGDFIERVSPRFYVQFSVQANGTGDVIERIVGLKSIQYPKPLLGEREWQGLVARNLPDRGDFRAARVVCLFRFAGEIGDGRRFKQCSQWQFDLERPANA